MGGKTTADPILEELRKVKGDLSRERSHDPRRVVERLKASQRLHEARLVNRTRKRSGSKRGR